MADTDTTQGQETTSSASGSTADQTSVASENPMPAAPSAVAPSASSSTSAGGTETLIDLLKDNLKRQIDSAEAQVAKTGKLIYNDVITNIESIVKEIKVLGGEVAIDLEALKAKWF